MIPRYEKKEISAIWSEENKFKMYLLVELSLLRALEKKKLVPSGIADTIEKSAKINIDRINEIELVTKHDIIAFCSSITEQFNAEVGKFFHFGVTSSDIIDTAITLQIKASLDLTIPALEKLNESILKFSQKHKYLFALGRSHGMFAEPLSFGVKFLGFYCEFKRRLGDLKEFYQNELTGQLSGAVGNYTVVDPDIEKEALALLKLKVEPVSTQVIPRDRISKLMNIHGLLASAIERISVEIRHLSRSEVNEVQEGFSKGQKGSSTMPHKKNPISSENLTGMSRIIRSHMEIASQNTVLWHERDISHSSAERLYLPDNFGLLFYSLQRLTSVMENLEVNEKNIQDRVMNNFTYLSSFYLHQLILRANESRETLYAVVQTASFSAKTAQDFYKFIKDELTTKKISLSSELPIFDLNNLENLYKSKVDQIFSRSI